MGKNKGPDPPNFQKYGVPFYSAAWVPYKSIKFDQEEDREQSTDEVSGGQKSSPAPESSAAQDYVVFAGGGGEGGSGIPNAVVLSRFDFASNALSDQPVAKLGTGSHLPYRMAVHPGGDGLVCSFPKSCRFQDGSRISLWQDMWCGEVALKVAYPVLFGLSCAKDASVAANLEFLGGSIQWNISFIRAAHD